jgi:HAD superfamily phosphatase (TIGR01668 family)
VRILRDLRPRETAETVFDVDYAGLEASGTRVLLFDLDNTLRKRWAPELFPGVEALMRRLARAGFSLGIITNRKRVGRDALIRKLASSFRVAHSARKPSRRAFLRMLSELGASPSEAAMIGDRRLTDVLGANRLGIHTILVTNPQASIERAPQVAQRAGRP